MLVCTRRPLQGGLLYINPPMHLWFKHPCAQFFDMGRYITWASGRGLGPGNLEFFGPQNSTRLSARCHFTGPKKLSISGAQPQDKNNYIVELCTLVSWLEKKTDTFGTASIQKKFPSYPCTQCCGSVTYWYGSGSVLDLQIRIQEFLTFLLVDGRIRIRTHNDGSEWPKKIRIWIHFLCVYRHR